MTNDAEAVLQLSATISLVGGLVGVLYYVWYALALSKLFAKLGAESWRGWVPVLNEMEILTRGGVPGWSVVYYFIPVVNLYGLYLKITAVHRINVQLGRGAGMTVLAVLLPPVWASILGWGATPAVAGVDDRRVEGGLATGDTRSQPTATGPLGAPPAPAAAPFTPAASDASGYALPVVQPPPAPAPGPAFSAPVDAPSLAPVPAAAPTAPAAGLIQNPWAQPGSAAAQAAPPQPSAAPAPAPASATPPAPSASTPPPPPAPPAAPVAAAAPPAPAGPPAPPVDSGFIVPPPSIGLPPSASAPVAPPAPPAAAAPVFVPAPTPSSPPPAPPAAPAFFAPDNGGDDDLDNTIVVDRRPVVPWKLRTDDGFVASLTASKVVLGRNPSSGEMDVQAIAIPDSSKTLSKTHARLDLVDGAWTLTDLHSTNGVIVIEADGSENLIDVDQTVPLQSRFLLGKVGMAVSFEEEQGS